MASNLVSASVIKSPKRADQEAWREHGERLGNNQEAWREHGERLGNNMKLAIIGKTGQLARALARRSVEHGISVECYGRDDCDLGAPPEVITDFISGLMKGHECDGVIIAAAYTAVDAAEDDYETALAVNGAAPAAIAKACAARNMPLVHVSTDYVFNGQADKPYKVDDPIDPINAYGRSKYVGERAVLEAHSRAAVLRTSWVFDGTGKNFMTTMLRLGAARDSLSIVGDQIGRPTYAGHLADACLATIKVLSQSEYKQAAGLFHVSGTGTAISWAEFARAIFEQASEHLPHSVAITPIPTSDYPTPAKRPAYSVLDCSRYDSAINTLPDWTVGLKEAYKEWERANHS